MSEQQSLDHCTKCGKQLRNGVDARYNYPDGTRCIPCGDGYKGWMKRQNIRELQGLQNRLSGIPEKSVEWKGTTEIGNYLIPTHLLTNWKESVIHCRNASVISVSRENPLFVFNSLQNRERIHREIFSYLGLPYHGDTKNKDSINLNMLLNEWLDEELKNKI